MMQVSTLLDHIDSGHMALPEFQRGYVWNRDQVRAMMDSAYRRHPIGSLLVWVTESTGAQHRGDGPLASGTVKLLLDGQQRLTTLYGIIRGKPPRFFDGNTATFTGLRFHLERQEFAFYSPIKMDEDPLWVDVTGLMKAGNDGLGAMVARLTGGIENAEEEATLGAVNDWVVGFGLPEGRMSYELTAPVTGRPVAVLDLAWPDGLQEGLSTPVAVLLNERQATLDVANAHGYRYFTTVQAFRDYVHKEVLTLDDEAPAFAQVQA